MRESILRAAAIASVALGVIVALTTWLDPGRSGVRAGLYGVFSGLLLVLIGVVAWALLNSLADITGMRTQLDSISRQLSRLESRLESRLDAKLTPEREAEPHEEAR